jgi:hypothetical protein
MLELRTGLADGKEGSVAVLFVVINKETISSLSLQWLHWLAYDL